MAGKGRASVEDMARVDAAVAAYVAQERSARVRTLYISRDELAQAVGVSTYRVVAAVARLVDAGLLQVMKNYDEFGGQQANSYALTQAGELYAKGVLHGMSLAQVEPDYAGQIAVE